MLALHQWVTWPASPRSVLQTLEAAEMLFQSTLRVYLPNFFRVADGAQNLKARSSSSETPDMLITENGDIFSNLQSRKKTDVVDAARIHHRHEKRRIRQIRELFRLKHTLKWILKPPGYFLLANVYFVFSAHIPLWSSSFTRINNIHSHPSHLTHCWAWNGTYKDKRWKDTSFDGRMRMYLHKSCE